MIFSVGSTLHSFTTLSHTTSIIVDFRINETLQTGAVGNRTYRGAKVSIYFGIHYNSISFQT